ncbi:MAG: molybdopterin synthase sulfur carrier subunit [Puniceicoccaceae bacterium 5H]|nr:MAG: molybdopterin synthase sulfur carrier subunit [Puniceicoccaceae bacterium 5H]
MKQLEVLYFGSLRAQRGTGHEAIHTTAESPRALYLELSRQHGFSLPVERILFAVDDDYTEVDAPLPERGTLAIMPPLAGG